MKHSSTYVFWGVMDLFYLVLVATPLMIGVGAMKLMWVFSVSLSHWPADLIVLAVATLLAAVSLIASTIMFLMKRKNVIWIAGIQAPFRVFFLVPSIPFIPWLASSVGIGKSFLLLGIVAYLEIVKILTIRDANNRPCEKTIMQDSARAMAE